MSVERLAPVDTVPVNLTHGLVDVPCSSMVVDRLAAGREAAVVVDDDESAGRDERLEVGQYIPRRLVHVTVKAEDGDGVDLLRQRGHRVAEPAFDEVHAGIPEPVSCEVPADLSEPHGERAVLVQLAARIEWIPFRVGRRKSLERVTD